MTASTPASAGHAQQQNRRLSLRDHRGFRVYWLGEATSRVGSSLYAVALPVIAAVELDATPGQVSTLASAVLAPVFVLALPAGVLGDRYSKRDLMMGTDLLAAAVVATVPVCWATGMLSMPVLYVVGLLLGTLAVLHQAAAIAIVPELVEPALLHRANSRVMAVFAMVSSKLEPSVEPPLSACSAPPAACSWTPPPTSSAPGGRRRSPDAGPPTRTDRPRACSVRSARVSHT